jgi:histidine ammonia-lyase
MLVHANVLLQDYSGIRYGIIDSMRGFLNVEITRGPCVVVIHSGSVDRVIE